MATESMPAPIAKPTKSKATIHEPKIEQERGGSAAGTNSSKSAVNKTITAAKSTTTLPKKLTSESSSPTVAKPRRKPRKLNNDTRSDTTLQSVSAPAVAVSIAQDPTAELDALKSRVRGLEAKVEALYDNSTTQPSRSPRRRGKGRKNSSPTQVSTLNTLLETTNQRVEDREYGTQEEETDEGLIRLAGELEVARQDLNSYHYRPQTRHITLRDSDDDVEEIPRRGGGAGVRGTTHGDKQVTFSGSYRIPVPTNVSVEDFKNIRNGVSAAQNLARTFLEQRRAAAAARAEQNQDHGTAQRPASTSARPLRSNAMNPSMQVNLDDTKETQSWSDWIGGYSLAITRAVKSIEHEAAMETQKGGSGNVRLTQASRTLSTPGMKRDAGKRPPAKAKLSSEQVHGLMS